MGILDAIGLTPKIPKTRILRQLMCRQLIFERPKMLPEVTVAKNGEAKNPNSESKKRKSRGSPETGTEAGDNNNRKKRKDSSAELDFPEVIEASGKRTRLVAKRLSSASKDDKVESMDDRESVISDISSRSAASSSKSNKSVASSSSSSSKKESDKGTKANSKSKKRELSPKEEEGKDEDFEVEKVIDYCDDQAGPLYLVKWKGYDHEENTWEGYENVQNCDDKLWEFYETRRDYIKAFGDKVVEIIKNGKKKRQVTRKLYLPPDPRPFNVRKDEFMSKHVQYKNDEQREREEKTEDAAKALWSNMIVLKNTQKWKTCHKLRWIDKVLNEELDKANRGELDGPKNRGRVIALRMQLLFREVEIDRELFKEELKNWEDEINEVTEMRPLIRVENDVDWAGRPEDFTYINSYVPGTDVVIPDNPPLGCDCSIACGVASKVCDSPANGFEFAYTPDGRIRVHPGIPIYECNKKCPCPPTCINRVVQDGRNDIELCIFRTSDGRGWGVKALKTIKKGTFVTLYVGQVICFDEAEQRGTEYDANGCTYLFDLDFNDREEDCPYTVDAAKMGNVSHFINHSCQPNLVVYNVWVNCLDPSLPQIAFFAAQNIAKGEELTFDYVKENNKDYKKSPSGGGPDVKPDADGGSSAAADGNNETGPSTSSSNEPIPSTSASNEAGPSGIVSATEGTAESTDESQAQAPGPKTVCLCGAPQCRKVLF